MPSLLAETEEDKTKLGALKRWCAFLGVAIVVLLLVLLPFIIRGNYLVWIGLYADGATQHATFLEYMFKNGLFSGSGGYDYNIGLGADYAVSFSYYMMFDPINLLLYILPRSNFLLSYSILICVRFILCAVCMYIYLRNRKIKQTLSIIFAVAYMLSGYMLFTFVRHPDLSSGAIYLPLVILGLEKAIDKNNPFILIVFVFLTTISSFYMAFMVTLFSVLYAAIYYVNKVHASGEKIKAKKFAGVFLRTAAYYLSGLLLASFVLFPVAYGYINASRSVNKGLGAYSLLDLLSIGGSFFAPFPGNNYTPVMFNAAVFLLAMTALAAAPRTVHGKMTIILTVCMFVPLAGYIMNMFNYANNRYTYMLSFSVCALIAEHLSTTGMKEQSGKEVGYMIKGAVSAAALLALLGVWYGVSLLFDKIHVAAVAVVAALAAAATIAAAYGLYRLYKVKFECGKKSELIKKPILLYSLVVVTLVNSLGFNVVYSEQFDNKERYDSLCSQAERYAASLQSEEFVRLDTQIDKYSNVSNRPLNNGYKGTVTYNTMFPSETALFLQSNGLYTFSPTLGMSGLNGRSALQALLSVKYMRVAQDGYLPMQFRACAQADELFETDDYVRFGTVFSEVIDSEYLYSLPEIERQYAMLRAVAVNGWETNYEHNALAARYGEKQTEAFTVKKGEKFEIDVDPTSGKSLYISFEISEPSAETFFVINSGTVSLETDAAPKGHQMYTGQKKFLYKLDENSDKVEFTVSSGASITFDNVEFFTVDDDEVLNLIRAAAAQPSLTDTVFTSKGFSGKISSDGGVMLVQLPYSKGWSAAVDGKEVEVLSADCGLMAIEVDNGEHEVEFTYQCQWLNAGIAVTAAAATAVAALAVTYSAIYIRKKRKKL